MYLSILKSVRNEISYTKEQIEFKYLIVHCIINTYYFLLFD